MIYGVYFLQIWNKLKTLRMNHGGRKLSIEIVSEVCGVSNSTYQRWETGESKPPFEAIAKLAEFYDISLNYFSESDQSEHSRKVDIEPLKKEINTLLEKIPELNDGPSEHWHKRKERFLTIAEVNRIAKLDQEIFKHRDIRTLFRAFNREDQDFWTDVLINVQNDWCRGRVIAFYALLKTSMIKPHWFKEEEEERLKEENAEKEKQSKKLG